METAQPSIEDLTSIFALEAVKGFGPQKFKALRDAGATPQQVLDTPSLLPMAGKRAEALRDAIAGIDTGGISEARRRAEQQLERAAEHNSRVVVYDDPLYPPNVLDSNNPVPVIYARGDAQLLCDRRMVACVGSREIDAPYNALHERFARYAVSERFTIVSGFALGADSVGHRAAHDASGRTVCVMPRGLDRPFPPENAPLWEELLTYPGAVMVSEFPFGRRADSLTLRKRNKLIVAFGRGVLVSQSSKTGGAMNAFRFGLEQHKPVATFEPDGSERTSGNSLIGSDPKAAGTVLGNDESEWSKWLALLS